jgi:hypothetical protein
LPATGLEVRVQHDGRGRFAGALSRAMDSKLGYHYGTPVPSLADDDQVTVTILTPPQVARHEGYETAFVETPPVSLSV